MSRLISTRVCVIIAAYCEAVTVGRVVRGLVDRHYHVLVVDDGSLDTTAATALAAGATVIKHPVDLGQGAALQTGVDYALSKEFDILATFDADGQHRASDVQRLTDALDREQADFALGSRFLGYASNLPRLRRLVLQTATLFTWLTTGMRLTDAHNGLRAMTRHGACKIKLRQNRMAHASEIVGQIAASGLRTVEVPVTIEYTPYSLAKGQRLGNSFTILLGLFAGSLHR